MEYDLIIDALKEAIKEYKARNELKSFIKSELIKAINGDKEQWITISGNHIKIEDGETPKQAFKKFEIKTSIEKIINGEKEEIIVKDVRDDLIQYGENNDIALLKGNIKGGIEHIKEKHEKDIAGIINAIVNGEVTKHIPNRKVELTKNNYIALLSLDFKGNKKTWLLTGYEKTKKEP